jgi:hypothetical protein
MSRWIWWIPTVILLLFGLAVLYSGIWLIFSLGRYGGWRGGVVGTFVFSSMLMIVLPPLRICLRKALGADQ